MSVVSITPEAAQARLSSESPKPLLLDVRSRSEHAHTSIKGSTLIPLPELAERLDELEPHKHVPILVYCHAGIRSLSAATLLRQAGFEAYSIAGGTEAWSVKIDPTVLRY